MVEHAQKVKMKVKQKETRDSKHEAQSINPICKQK